MNFEDLLPQDGFGESTQAELDELRKALDIGTAGAASPTGGDSLRAESLESTLKLASYQMQNARLWNLINKAGANSTVEEYNKLSAYGSDAGGFISSGMLPEEEDSVYSRENQFVKFCGTTRSVNHPATLVRTVPADLIGRETLNGALWLIGKINTALYVGDAVAVPVEWNGLMTQIETGGGTVIDMAGAPLTQEAIDNAAQIISDNFGIPAQLFGNGKIFTDFSKNFHNSQRWNVPQAASPGIAGTPVTGYSTTNGVVTFQADTFAKRGSAAPVAATSFKAPNAPTIADALAAADPGSKFLAGDAGTYKWQATAVNQYGESAPSALSGGQAIAAGEKVDVTITDQGGANEATAYKIYRTEKDGSVGYYIGKITARNKVGNVYQATTVYSDLNVYRERMFSAMLLDMTPQSLEFKQLSPMIRMPLAQVAPSIRWMQLLYGTPVVYNPLKNVVFRNIGVSA